MKKYVGTKLIEAEPMKLGDYNKFKGWTIPANENPEREGYKVKYSDDYISWSPKEVFEKAYLKLESDKNTVTQQDVDNFIAAKEVTTVGEKTTIVKVTLKNGFELVEASSCVDKVNYDEKYGAKICMEKIKDKIWFLLGFLLQTALNGVKE